MKKIIFLDFDSVQKRVNQVHTPEILAINELLSFLAFYKELRQI